MYLIDTDIIIWTIRQGRGNKVVWQAIDSFFRSQPDEVAISTITVAEIYKNIRSSEVSDTEKILAKHAIVPVSIEIAKSAGYYWQQYNQKIKTLSLPDCIIAATSQIEKAKLLTLNSRHFPMKDIEVLNPLS